MNGKEELLSKLEKLKLLAGENICGLEDIGFKAMSSALDLLVGSKVKKEISKEQCAKHFGVSAKTIDRWIAEKGFPKGRRNGYHELSFSVDEVAEWAMKNNKLIN